MLPLVVLPSENVHVSNPHFYTIYNYIQFSIPHNTFMFFKLCTYYSKLKTIILFPFENVCEYNANYKNNVKIVQNLI